MHLNLLQNINLWARVKSPVLFALFYIFIKLFITINKRKKWVFDPNGYFTHFLKISKNASTPVIATVSAFLKSVPIFSKMAISWPVFTFQFWPKAQFFWAKVVLTSFKKCTNL